MLRITRIQKVVMQFACTTRPVHWLATASCLLGMLALLLTAERLTAHQPVTGADAAGETTAAADLISQPSTLWTGFDNVGVVVGTTVSHTFALAVADLDGDGNLDLVSADESGSIIAWQNHGTPFSGGWTKHQIGTASLPVGLAAGDLDDDGHIDVAVAGAHGPKIWRNDGSPFDGEWSSWQIGDRTVGTVKIADMNGNGRLDLVTGGGLPWWQEPDDNNWITVWYAPASPFTQTWSATDVGLAYYTPNGLDVGDLDNDGDNDIVIGTNHAPPVGDVNHPVPREDWPDVYQVRAFRNDGEDPWTTFNIGRDPEIETLAYVAYHGFWGASVTHVDLADLDKDGHLDIVATERVEGDFLVMGWHNDGTPFSGELWAPSAIAKGPVHNWLEDDVLWAEAGDLDLDGNLDVVSGSRTSLEPWPLNIWANTGIAFGSVISETHWLRHSISSRREDIWTGKVADLDQDGDLDLATVSHALVAGDPSKIRVWENAGFRLSISPADQTVAPGETITYSVTALTWRGFNYPIHLWVSGLPAGIEATWSHDPLSPGSSTVLTLATALNGLEGKYSMNVVGIGGRFVQSEPFTLTLCLGCRVYLPVVQRSE